MIEIFYWMGVVVSFIIILRNMSIDIDTSKPEYIVRDVFGLVEILVAFLPVINWIIISLFLIEKLKRTTIDIREIK